jgi:gag-polypeptide of LTR copia-type
VRDKAIKDAAPWTAGNTLCLVRIINAVPRQQIHQVKCTVYAKDTWNSLRSIYLPRNAHHIQSLTNDITTFCLTPDLDLREWIDVIQILYNDLCDLDSEAMSDRTFMLLILGNISASSKWQEIGLSLRECLGEYNNYQPIPTPITSTDFVVWIRDEHWFCSKNNAQVAAEALSFTAWTSED